MLEYGAILIVFTFAAALAGALCFVNNLLGPKRPNPTKQEPFECGEKPFELPAGRFPVKFYIIAMLFILFDVELVFLFPWAVISKDLGWFGYIEMALFLLVVIAGFAYAWSKGALEWE